MIRQPVPDYFGNAQIGKRPGAVANVVIWRDPKAIVSMCSRRPAPKNYNVLKIMDRTLDDFQHVEIFRPMILDVFLVYERYPIIVIVRCEVPRLKDKLVAIPR